MKAEHLSQSAGDGSRGPARSALDWPRDTGRVCDFMKLIALRKRRQLQRRVQGAAALLVVLGVAGFSVRSNLPPSPAAPADALVAMPPRQTLADGSVVELKDDAEITVEFSADIRRVTLRRGEAHFQVAKDVARPFVVDAGGIEIRAVGTGFVVQRSLRAIDVLVTEGRVAVEADAAHVASAAISGAENSLGIPAGAAGAGPRALAMLDARKGVVVEWAAGSQPPRAERIRLFEVSSLELDQRLAWRAPRLDFSSMPLADAIRAINRHSTTQLVLGDTQLGAIELSGVMRANNVEPLLRMLENNYGISVDRSEGKIVLRKSRP